MQWMRMTIIAVLGTLAGVSVAWADGGHHGHGYGHGSHTSVGVVIGPVWGGPGYYPARPYYSPYYSPYYAPYPYYPPVVIESRPPPVYIEQSAPVITPVPEAPTVAAPVQYWYYCTAGRGYYPYVKECPGGWQKVLPTPPGE